MNRNANRPHGKLLGEILSLTSTMVKAQMRVRKGISRRDLTKIRAYARSHSGLDTANQDGAAKVSLLAAVIVTALAVYMSVTLSLFILILTVPSVAALGFFWFTLLVSQSNRVLALEQTFLTPGISLEKVEVISGALLDEKETDTAEKLAGAFYAGTGMDLVHAARNLS